MSARVPVLCALAAGLLIPSALSGQGPARGIADTIPASRFPGGEVHLHLEVQTGRVIVTRGVGSAVIVDPRQHLTGAARDSVLVAPPFPGKRGRHTAADGIHYKYFPGVPVELRVELPSDAKVLTIDVKDTADVFVDNFAGELEIRSARGKVEAYDVVGPVLIEAGSGSIYSTVRTGPNGAMSLLARQGDVFLGLPLEAHANVDAETRRGKIYSNASLSEAVAVNPVQVFGSTSSLPQSSASSRGLGRIGRGGPLVRVVTLQGGVLVWHCTYCMESVPHR